MKPDEPNVAPLRNSITSPSCTHQIAWIGTHARLVLYGSAVALFAFLALVLGGASIVASRNSVSASTPPSTAVQDYNKAQELQYSHGNCSHAIPLYLSAINKYAMYVSAYLGLGNCYQTVGSIGAAIAEYDKAITIDPTNYGLYITRAGSEAATGNTGAAIADDLMAMRLSSQQEQTYTTIADSFASYADFADAIMAMGKAIAVVPSDPSLYEHRAGIYLQAKDYAHAYADYNMAIKLAPFLASRASIYSDLANVYDGQGDFNSAFGAIATAIRLQPDSTHFYLQSGNIHQDAGTLPALKAALGLYDQALRRVIIGADAEAAYEDKGDTLVKLGQTKQAIAAYTLATQLARRDPIIQLRIKGKIKAARSAQS